MFYTNTRSSSSVYTFVYTKTMSRPRRDAPEILSTRDTRYHLTTFLKTFREAGARAEPIFFGAHRRREAVVIAAEAYDELLDALDDAAIALEVRNRDAADTGERIELADLIRRQGFDPAEFGVSEPSRPVAR